VALRAHPTGPSWFLPPRREGDLPPLNPMCCNGFRVREVACAGRYVPADTPAIHSLPTTTSTNRSGEDCRLATRTGNGVESQSLSGWTRAGGVGRFAARISCTDVALEELRAGAPWLRADDGEGGDGGVVIVVAASPVNSPGAV
jgi:hypothetical protein